MKPSNCASATGFMPCAARPTVTPAMVVSSSGVSSTRSSPNFSCRPTVARNTPPLTPTSSPSTTTESSCCISYASAWVTASIRVMAAMSVRSFFQRERKVALLFQVRRDLGEGVVEHRGHRLHLAFEIGIHFVVHPLVALVLQRLFLLLVPGLVRFEVHAQALDRILLPGVLDLVLAAIAAGVVGGGVVAQAIGDAFDHAAAVTLAGAIQRVLHRLAHGDDVVAIDLNGRK